MPPIIRISGIAGYDGEYPLDLEERFLTNHELHELKKETGVRGGELQEAMEAGDNDVLVMLAVFAVRRGGKTIHPDVFWNAEAGSIDFDPGKDDEEGEESLPPPSEPNEPSTSGGKPGSSGATSEEPPENTVEEPEPSPVTPLRTGPPPSDTGADSDPETLTA